MIYFNYTTLLELPHLNLSYFNYRTWTTSLTTLLELLYFNYFNWNISFKVLDLNSFLWNWNTLFELLHLNYLMYFTRITSLEVHNVINLSSSRSFKEYKVYQHGSSLSLIQLLLSLFTDHLLTLNIEIDAESSNSSSKYLAWNLKLQLRLQKTIRLDHRCLAIWVVKLLFFR